MKMSEDIDESITLESINESIVNSLNTLRDGNAHKFEMNFGPCFGQLPRMNSPNARKQSTRTLSLRPPVFISCIGALLNFCSTRLHMSFYIHADVIE